MSTVWLLRTEEGADGEWQLFGIYATEQAAKQALKEYADSGHSVWVEECEVKDQPMKCADCGGPIGKDNGPSDGWQLEDGRTVCQACCVEDTKALAKAAVLSLVR